MKPITLYGLVLSEEEREQLYKAVNERISFLTFEVGMDEQKQASLANLHSIATKLLQRANQFTINIPTES